MKGSGDIVITSLQSWHIAMGGNIVNMAKELAKENRVLFINYAVDRLTLLRQKDNPAVRKYKENKLNPAGAIEQISPNLWLYTPETLLESVSQIKSSWLFDKINRLNTRRFGKDIKRVIKQLGFNDFILFTDSDFYRSFNLKETLNPCVLVYYIRDYMIATNFFRHHGARMEEAIIRKADLVVANSEFLATYAREYNPNSFYVGQGCDSELFSADKSFEIPEDMKEIREKFNVIIGYVGALRVLRIDMNLLENISANHPEWAFVLVGWEDEAFQKSNLHGMPNIFFLGPKKESELPVYINTFDVAINPQVYNVITKGNYPRKIDEYLAMGKPVLATRTETMEMFADYCYLGSTPEEYCNLIEKALQEDTPELHQKRIELGRLHSWKNNIREIFEKIELVRPS